MGFKKLSFVGAIRKKQLDQKKVNIKAYSVHLKFGFLVKRAILGSVDQTQYIDSYHVTSTPPFAKRQYRSPYRLYFCKRVSFQNAQERTWVVS